MRILLADDHALFAEGLRNLLQVGGYEVVGSASNGLEALEQARRFTPDLILMDVRMPVCNGLEATRLIKTELPEIQIVMLSTSDDNSDLFEAIKSGASGYLLKNLKPNVLFSYLEGLARGEAPLSRELSTCLLHEFTQQGTKLNEKKRVLNQQGVVMEGSRVVPIVDEQSEQVLTNRQREVLEMVASGLSYKEVGASLHLSENTVKYHMGEIVRALHLKNRNQAVAFAVSTGLVKVSGFDGRSMDEVDASPPAV
jgi:DNA-binding NarL/FixJ family response regulator